ncbi:glycosyltransferase family 28 protein [Salinimonas sediminis]|uniref:Oligosaccharide biosynthesis protein Alg14 n=1 Tax=Salinimonas sediminis TaxID=2303538 RepID=A0A346NMV9_9ALTE|nr:oligosaccharide biosynthesis protein Alg14 [Salinimonas sediminis]
MKKIILVASPGGHFVQLSLLSDKLVGWKRVIIGTYSSKPSFMEGEKYYAISDFSRTDIWKSLYVGYKSFKILKTERPSVVVTTGAAPGLIFSLIAKLYGVRTIWIDSVANSNKLSLSGNLAKIFGITVLSQWENVCEHNDIEYHGRLI